MHNGVWFNATSLQGPWLVASSVPAVIYSIPPSSPLYYVTYVKVYASTPQVVVAGYTPGYMGTVVSADGVVVYGTGYTYQAYISPTIYYPAPVTYGYATNMTWTPWLGWAFAASAWDGPGALQPLVGVAPGDGAAHLTGVLTAGTTARMAPLMAITAERQSGDRAAGPEPLAMCIASTVPRAW